VAEGCIIKQLKVDIGTFLPLLTWRYICVFVINTIISGHRRHVSLWV